MHNKPRPRPGRRHTTATGIRPSQEEDLTRLSSSPVTHPIHSVQHAASEPVDVPSDIEQAIPQESTPPRPGMTSAPPIQPFDVAPQSAKEGGFLGQRWFKLKNRRHHPATEQAYRKSLWGNLKTIIFSSWVNVLLVFVPVVCRLSCVSDNRASLHTQLESMPRSCSV